MTEFLSKYAQSDIPVIEYAGITPEQAKIAFETAAKFPDYELQLMPIDTLQDALQTAREYKAHLQALGDAKSREMGAFAIFSTREELSSEDLAIQLHRERNLRLFIRIRMPQGASSYELLKDYYEPQKDKNT